MTATCATCHQPILWARTEAGKTMPVDLHPVATGTLVVVPFPADVLRHGGRVTTDVHAEHLLDDPGPRYVSHFATCPQAAEHRKPRTPRPR